MHKKKLFVLVLVLLLLTGCTKTLKVDDKIIKNEETGQTLTQNILCRPTDKNLLKIYEKYEKETKVSKLPECTDFKANSGHDEGLWTNIFVKPLAWLIIKLGGIVKNYGLALIIAGLAIRLLTFPLTQKTAMQSELIAKAQPELDRIEKKYDGKDDQESMLKKSQEIGLVYKKFNINPFAGCLYAFIQLPIFIAFFEGIQRVPVIFEDKFLTLNLGVTPAVALSQGNFQYIIIIIILGLITYFSFKFNATSSQKNPQTQIMNKSMVVMIIVMSLFMSTAIDIYWLTSNSFTIVQNLLIKRRKIDVK